MVASIQEFFDGANEDWKYHEISRDIITVFKVRMSRNGQTTAIQLDDPARNSHPFFITGMEATDTELRINDIYFGKEVQKVDPPLIVTSDPNQQNRVHSLFKAGPIGTGTPPYDGTVTKKEFGEVAEPTHPGKVSQLSLRIESRGNATKVLTADLQLQTKLGITIFMGQFYGVFFKYVRFFGEPPARPPHVESPAPTPPIHRYHSSGGQRFVPPGPFEDWRSRHIKEIWDLEYYENRLKEQNRQPDEFEKQQLAKLDKLRKELRENRNL